MYLAGIPLPPTDLSVHINNLCEIQLNWKSPFILSSDESTKTEILTPLYIIYGFLIKSGLDMDLFYRSETNSSAANFTLDFETISIVVMGTNFSLIAFSVSTKLTLVGEGSLSTRKVITKEDIQGVCKQGTCFFRLPSLMYVYSQDIYHHFKPNTGEPNKQGPDDDRETDSNYSMLIGSP